MDSPFGGSESNGGVDNTVILIGTAALVIAALVAFATGNTTVGWVLLIVAAILFGVYWYRRYRG